MTAIAKTTAPEIEDDRTGLEVETLKRALADNLYYIQGKFKPRKRFLRLTRTAIVGRGCQFST
jgi:hypothetical protein